MKKKLVIGDDSIEVAKSAVRALRMNSVEIDAYFAETPEGLLDLARQHPDAIVVTDLRYTDKGMEGFDVLEQFQGKERTVYLWSANADDPGIRERAIQLGAAGVIDKRNLRSIFEIVSEDAETEKPGQRTEPYSGKVLVVAAADGQTTRIPALRKTLNTVFGDRTVVIGSGELRTVEGRYETVVYTFLIDEKGRGRRLVEHEDKYRKHPLGHRDVIDIPFHDIVAGIGNILASQKSGNTGQEKQP